MQSGTVEFGVELTHTILALVELEEVQRYVVFIPL